MFRIRQMQIHPKRFHPNIIFSYLTLCFLGLTDNLRGPLYPEILQKFQVSSSLGAWYFATSSIFSFSSAALVPKIVSYLGYKKTLQLAVFMMTLSQVLSAFAGSFAQLLISAGTLGFSIGLMGVLQNVLVMVASTPENRSRVSGGLHANYAGASLLAPLFVGLVSGWGFSFQDSFYFSSLMGIGILFALSQVDEFEGPKQHVSEDTKKPKVFSLPEIYFAVILSSYVISEIIISSRLSQYAREALGWDLQSSSRLVLIFFIGLFASRLLMSLISLRMPARHLLTFCLLMSIFATALGVYVHPYWFGLVGFVMGPAYPISITVLHDYFSKNLQSATTAAVVGSGLFVVMMHLGAGSITDRFGVTEALWLGPAFAAIALVLHVSYPLFFGKSWEPKS